MSSSSIREAMLYAGKSGNISMKNSLKYSGADIQIIQHNFPFSVIIYNMAMLVAPAGYNGTDRSGALNKLIHNLKNEAPDIVGICEIFSDGERNHVKHSLNNIYPYASFGPDEADLESDGGLLVLSKHPFIASRDTIYRSCAGAFADCLANKGIIHVKIKPVHYPMPVDLFFSHTQNIEESGGKNALYKQIIQMNQFIEAHTSHNSPVFIMGDLNIPAENNTHYSHLINTLGHPVDLWKTKHPNLGGETNIKNNNFYEDNSDKPSSDSRLDYILLKSGNRFLPILNKIDLLKWTHNGRQISDHFGLKATFNNLVEFAPTITGTIQKVTVKLISFNCVEETNELGSDTVFFHLTITDSNNNSKTGKSTKKNNVDTGEFHTISMSSISLIGDIGSSIKLKLKGTEYDKYTSNENLGTRELFFSRTELLLMKGYTNYHVFPFLTGDGGEYAVTVRIIIE